MREEKAESVRPINNIANYLGRENYEFEISENRPEKSNSKHGPSSKNDLLTISAHPNSHAERTYV